MSETSTTFVSTFILSAIACIGIYMLVRYLGIPSL